MVINIGLRFDQFNPDDDYVSNLVNPEGEKSKVKLKNVLASALESHSLLRKKA